MDEAIERRELKLWEEETAKATHAARAVAGLADLSGTIAHVMALRRRGCWSREALAAFQKQRLDELLIHARECSPFYADLLSGSATPALHDCPVIDKRALIADFDRIVTDRAVRMRDVQRFVLCDPPPPARFFRGSYVALLTSGTTGLRGFGLHDREMARLNCALPIARLDNFYPRRLRRPRHATVMSVGRRYYSGYYATFLPAFLFGYHPFPADGDFSAVVRGLNEVDPDMIAFFPSVARRLIAARRDGALRIHPRRVVCGGETLGLDLQRELFETFRCDVRNVYGTAEAGPIAIQCSEGRLHIAEDAAVIEVVDDANRSVPEGELGDAVLVTHLWNRVLPLIRYRFEDRIRLGTSQCACGSGHRWIAEFAGRTGAVVPLRGRLGRNVPVLWWKVVEKLLGQSAVAQAQILLLGADRLRVNLVLDGGSNADDGVRSAKALISDTLAALEVDVESLRIDARQVHDLERIPGSGKAFAFAEVRDVPPKDPQIEGRRRAETVDGRRGGPDAAERGTA